MAAQVDVLCLHRVDQRLGDPDGECTERSLLHLELHRSEHDLFANLALDVSAADFQRSPVQRTRDGNFEVREGDRLHEVVQRALGERRHRGAGVIHSTEHQHREIAVERVCALHELDARYLGHPVVAEHHDEGLLLQEDERGRAGRTRMHFIAARLEELGERMADRILIVHDEDARDLRSDRSLASV